MIPLLLVSLAAGQVPAIVTPDRLPVRPTPVQMDAPDPTGVLLKATGGKAVALAFADELVSDAILYPADPTKLDEWVLKATPAPADRVFRLVASSGPADGIVYVFVKVPGTKPPAPMPPKPQPPGPTDPLVAKFQGAYDQESAASKADSLKLLTELYRQAGPLAEGAASVADLKAKVKAVASQLQIDLPLLRAAVNAEVAAVLPADGPLADADRKALSALFARIAAALAAVK